MGVSVFKAGAFSKLADKKFKFGEISLQGKVFLKDLLGLTSAEISLNSFNKGEGNTFVHVHRHNEEIYIIVAGKGIFYADGKEFPIEEGDCVKCPVGQSRALTAAKDSALSYICVQAKQGSLDEYTQNDASIPKAEFASWMK